MPSPAGHALAGVAIGWLLDGRQGLWNRVGVATAAAYGFIAAAPDLDLLLPMTHRGASHGVGAAVVAGVVALAVTRSARTAAVCAAVYGSHVLLDWLATDTTPPIGLMALWPFSSRYYESPWHIFMAVSRRYWLPEFWAYNFRVLVREVLILGPFVVMAAIVRARRQ